MLAAWILFPINWGIESFKWKLITGNVEKISFWRAQQSVYAGICVGNLAPGRATEFLGKLHFFSPEKRVQISLLHFINGFFQLSITIVLGVISFLLHQKKLSESTEIYTAAGILSVILMIIFLLLFLKINPLVHFIQKKSGIAPEAEAAPIVWKKQQLLFLWGLSILRYFIFTWQFYLLLVCFNSELAGLRLFYGISMYFLITSILPMFSIIEPAIRATIAMVVFEGANMHASGLALAALLLWLINIVFPSVLGYLVLLRENVGLHSFRFKKSTI